MTVPSIKPKGLKAKLEIELPAIQADAQAFQANDPKKMAEFYKKQIEDNLIEILEDFYADDTMSLSVTVNVVDEVEA